MDRISSLAQEKLRHRIEEHCGLLHSDYVLLEPMIDKAAGKGGKEASVTEAYEIAQRITGLSGTNGFSEVSQRANALADALRLAATERRQPGEDERTRIRECFELLRHCIERLTPECSRLYDADLASPFRDSGFRRISFR